MTEIALRNIRKMFGNTVAVDDVSLEIHPGERLALVGENGAGKSSLMNVLYGLYRPDAGDISIDGKTVALRSPKDALRLGIGMVHQHFMLVPTLTVAENVVLGAEPVRHGLIDLNEAKTRAREVCQRLGFTLDPDARAEDLSVGAQQRLEIVKALSRGARVLILDEPTAVLAPQEAEELYASTKRLAEQGTSVVFVTHKLREVLSNSDRIAVMRRGQLVCCLAPGETSIEDLASRVMGTEAPAKTSSSRTAHAARAPALELRDVTVKGRGDRPALEQISLTVSPGEVVGIAGVDGNGQQELALVATGLLPATSGSILVGGEPMRAGAMAFREAGVAHIPEDRLRLGLIADMTLEENLTLGRHRRPPFARGGRIDFASRRRRSIELLADFDVRPREPHRRAGELSGGNQQKWVVAREIDTRPRVLVVMQPTRGLDIAAVNKVHDRILAERDRGGAVLLMSLDLDELLSLSDRLSVLYGGRIVADVRTDDVDVAALGRLMLGGGRAQERAP